jgi:hypothetical protein
VESLAWYLAVTASMESLENDALLEPEEERL